MAKHTAAASNVGVIRTANQDSGYAGTYLSVVADGMGGHAGGDVASHLVIRHMLQLDKEYPTPKAAQQDVLATMLQANDMLADVVYEHPELAGLGTTVSSILRVGDKVVVAHIGDSRVYLLRDGKLSQVTIDHTFVQRLIDSGRITEEEAHEHPRRSVLMRVLGDVDALPEIDSMILETQPGDRWMLCSDGLSGVVNQEQLFELLSKTKNIQKCADALIQASLDGGAPDNTTVVVTDITEDELQKSAVLVGSADSELPISPPAPSVKAGAKKQRPKPKSLPISTGGMSVPSALTAELDAVKVKRIRRRFVLAGALVLLGGIILISGILGYKWSQEQYYVGADKDSVVIYQGIPQNFAGFSLSHVFNDTNISLDSLTAFERQQVSAGITFSSLSEARAQVDNFENRNN